MPSKLMCGFIPKPHILKMTLFLLKCMKSFKHHIKYINLWSCKDFSGDTYFEYFRNSTIFKQFNILVEYMRTSDQSKVSSWWQQIFLSFGVFMWLSESQHKPNPEVKSEY